jgi:hypothetical protein
MVVLHLTPGQPSADLLTSPLLLEGVTWADLDHRQRLVLTKNDGCLYASELQHVEFAPQLLANMNGQRPESVSTPEWATTWEKQGSQGN